MEQHFVVCGFACKEKIILVFDSSTLHVLYCTYMYDWLKFQALLIYETRATCTMYHSHTCTKAIPLLKCLINYMYRYCLLGILVLCKACSTSNFGMIVPFNLYCNDSECVHVHVKCIWQKLIIAQISITWIVKHYNFNSVQDSSNMNQTSRFRMLKCWQYHVLLIFQLCVMALWQLHGLIVWMCESCEWNPGSLLLVYHGY